MSYDICLTVHLSTNAFLSRASFESKHGNTNMGTKAQSDVYSSCHEHNGFTFTSLVVVIGSSTLGASVKVQTEMIHEEPMVFRVFTIEVLNCLKFLW